MHLWSPYKLGALTSWCDKWIQLRVTHFDVSKLHVVKGDIVRLLYFVHNINALELWFFYNNEVIIILSTMGTHQGNLFREPLFGLTHFWTLQFAKVQFPICLFPTIVDDIHIIGHPSVGCINIEFIFLKFNYEIGLSIQPHKCELFCPH